MTIVSVAVIWLVVGLVAAVIFGAVTRGTNRLREDDELPQWVGAEIEYMRRNKRHTPHHAKNTTAHHKSGKHHAAG